MAVASGRVPGIAWAGEVAAVAAPAWLVEGLLPAGACALLAGEPKVGKSWLAMDLAVAVATGTPWLGRPVHARGGSALYVSGEGGAALWSERVEVLARGRGRGRAQLPLALATERISLARGGAERVASIARAMGATLVVLDPLAALAPGLDENDAGQVGRILGDIRAIAERGAEDGEAPAVLLVHHTRKPGANAWSGRRAHAIRGSSALHGWADVVILAGRGRIDTEMRLDVEARAYRAPEPVRIVREEGREVERSAAGVERERAAWRLVATPWSSASPGGRRGALPGQARPPVAPLASEAPDPPRRPALDARVLAVVGGAGGRPLSANAIFAAIRGDRGSALRAVRVLIASGRLVEAPGGRGVVLAPVAPTALAAGCPVPLPAPSEPPEPSSAALPGAPGRLPKAPPPAPPEATLEEPSADLCSLPVPPLRRPPDYRVV